MIKLILLAIILCMVGCSDERQPDETVTVRYTDSTGYTSTDTYEFYYKDGKKVYGDITEDEDETSKD